MAKEKITTSIYWDKSLISNNNVCYHKDKHMMLKEINEGSYDLCTIV